MLVFSINGTVHRLCSDQVDPTVKLSTFVRGIGLTGTKTGCWEGGCGSCAVLLSKFDASIGRVVTTSTNACLKPIVELHGYNVTTVEGIGSPENPHPIQKRFHKLNASQCGFCTPGFVVSMYSQLGKKPHSTPADIEDALDGNLCRCTGYRPIIEVGNEFATNTNTNTNATSSGEEPPIPNDQLSIQAELDASFPAELKELEPVPSHFSGSNVTYYRPTTLEELYRFVCKHTNARIVCARTSAGVYKESWENVPVMCSVADVKEMKAFQVGSNGVVAGASTTISGFIGLLMKAGEEVPRARQTFHAVATVVKQIAGVHVRDTGSIAGNLSMAKEFGFSSDLATPLCAIGANVTILEIDPSNPDETPVLMSCSLYDFLQQPTSAGRTSLIVSVTVPFPEAGTHTGCFRTAIRSSNAHAITNATFHAKVSEQGLVTSITAIYGAVGLPDVPGQNAPKRNDDISRSVVGKTLGKGIVRHLCANFQTGDFVQGEYKLTHRRRLVKAFLVQFLEDVKKTLKGLPSTSADRTRSFDQHYVIDTDTSVGKAIPRLDGLHHSCGTAKYVSDKVPPSTCLHAAWVVSRIAKGRILSIPKVTSETYPGKVRLLTAADVQAPLKNEVPSVMEMFGETDFPGRELFASGSVVHCGQAIGLVIADSREHAVAAARSIERDITYEEEVPIVTVRDAQRAGAKPAITSKANKGSIDSLVGKEHLHVAEVQVRMPSQKHFYMETQAAYADQDDRKFSINAACQFPTYMQDAVANALGVHNNEVQFTHHRTGGSFGGKVTPHHAIAVAVAAKLSGRPVKLHVERQTDTALQGGREDTTANVRVTFDDDGSIHGVQYEVFKNAGAAKDSTAWTIGVAMPRGIWTTYDIPHQKGYFASYITNTTPRQATRAPGEIESTFIAEQVVDRVAHQLGIHSQKVRERNFLRPTSVSASGYTVPKEEWTFDDMYANLMQKRGWAKRVEDSISFNEDHHMHKKGVAITPFIYHLETQEASVLVNIYRDGSVLVHHRGSEIGQGLHTKLLQCAQAELERLGVKIPLKLFKSAGNDTFTLPSQGITGGSTSSESDAIAVVKACQVLVERLRPVLSSVGSNFTWVDLVKSASMIGVNLSSQYNTSASDNFEYAQICLGGVQVELDVLTCRVKVEVVDIEYDAAKSLNPAIDVGQIEGAFTMGLGYILNEDVGLNASGQETATGTWKYKIPTVHDVPQHLHINLIHNNKFSRGILSSKASGEPPLCIASAVSSAVNQAVHSARADAGLGGFSAMALPFSPSNIAKAIGTTISLD